MGSATTPGRNIRHSTIKPAWLIQDIPVLSTLTDPQYSAICNCDFWIRSRRNQITSALYKQDDGHGHGRHFFD